MREKRTAEESYRLFCAGDQSAFDAIMEEFQQNLIFFLHGYVHNLETAEDLAEDTFVELLLRKGAYRYQSSLKTFIFAVARHKAIDHLRRERRRASVGLDEIKEQSDGLPLLEEIVIQNERAAMLHKTLADMPEDYREVLYLLYIERQSYDDIARIMRKSRKQIDNLAYRARQAMRNVLGKEGIIVEEYD